MSDYEFIKEFQKIKLSTICKKLKINDANISNGTTSDENFRKVKNEIIRELLMIFISDNASEFPILYLYNEQLKKLEKENKMLREMI